MIDIEKKLKENGMYVSKTVGSSMEPMLKEGRDTVIIVPPVFPLKKYDVPVYRRGDHYTMHRIIRISKNGYVICGDNRSNFERDITDNEIVGVLAAFIHNNKFIDCKDKAYLKYAARVSLGSYIRCLRHIWLSVLNKIKGNVKPWRNTKRQK